MNTDPLILYVIVSFFYIISPGPAIFLALSNGMSANMKSVSLSSLGNILALFVLSAISIIGLGSLLVASASLFVVVKVLGAAYLVYLGIRQFRVSNKLDEAVTGASPLYLRSNGSYFTQGFVLAVTNPKPILFFIAIFPQFVDINSRLLPQFLVLTGIFMLLSFLSLFSYGFMANSARTLFSHQRALRWFHRVTGGLFIGMGIALLQLKRNTV